jgi:hypothetical protein
MLYLILLILGIILLAASVFAIKRLLVFIRAGERAEGMLTRYEEKEDDGSIFYTPVFEFKTLDNREVVYRYPVSRSPAMWSIGRKEIFIYNPDNLNSVRLLNFSILSWAIILMAVAMALIVTGGGYYLLQGYLK